tara:strand:- start:8581 stop:8742 length:162 start_codon:yes stop_codon:yes gene_type:complete
MPLMPTLLTAMQINLRFFAGITNAPLLVRTKMIQPHFFSGQSTHFFSSYKFLF